jgi:prefoldin subunit 5
LGELIKSLKKEIDQLKDKNKELQQFLDVQKSYIEKIESKKGENKGKSILKNILN